MSEQNSSKVAPAIITGSIIIGASIVLGLWLAWPRYDTMSSLTGPIVVDTRTGTLYRWNDIGSVGSPTIRSLDGSDE